MYVWVHMCVCACICGAVHYKNKSMDTGEHRAVSASGGNERLGLAGMRSRNGLAPHCGCGSSVCPHFFRA